MYGRTPGTLIIRAHCLARCPHAGGGETAWRVRPKRTLERDGLLTRTITPSVPVRVDYQLTALGKTILPVVGATKQWSEAHIGEIHAARESYDRANRG